MSDKNDSVLDKAESLARRILERLGAKVDSKLGPESQETLSPRQVGELTSRIEHVIDSNLKEDKQGVKRVSPNRFKVLFTYEESSRLNTSYIDALADELKAGIYEFINNRRYEIHGPIEVETGRDLFAKSTVIKASFEDDTSAGQPASTPAPTSAHVRASTKQAAARTIYLQSASGQRYRVELKAQGAPSYIGRAAGNAVRIDDASISRLHCSIALRGTGEVVVSDLGSANGTSVNGQMLGSNEARPINDGDTIGVGDISLTVSETD